jgi:hypothetical protein
MDPKIIAVVAVAALAVGAGAAGLTHYIIKKQENDKVPVKSGTKVSIDAPRAAQMRQTMNSKWSYALSGDIGPNNAPLDQFWSS